MSVLDMNVGELAMLIRLEMPAPIDKDGFPKSGTILSMEYICGFEMFGAHESWGKGWRVSDGRHNVDASTLQEALRIWSQEAGVRLTLD